MENNTNLNIATQVILKCATEMVGKGAGTLEEATTQLLAQYDRIFNTLKGESVASQKESVTTPKIELEVTPIPKNTSTKTYEDVKADSKAHKSYTAAFTKLESLKDKTGVDDLSKKIKDSTTLTPEMKESLLALLVKKEEEILKEIGV